MEEKENLVVTLGGNGCLIKSTNEHIPAKPQGTVVDTTGAGDTFNGVLAVMLAEGKSIAEAATVANTACGLGVTRQYAASSIPTRAEVEALLK